MKLSTIDQTAVAVLLSGASEQEKQASLDGLLVHTKVEHGVQCPECQSGNVCNNGLKKVDLTYLCESCGHQWSPNI